ncbi:MAG: heat-inducible transcription repressor HrcA [Anaerofustis stercorihominis]|nr:heat-inducible transcription repressor HrcA [Anaerofustis stercorihominis]
MAKNDERKYEILNAIIKDYIHTAEPVGSRTLEKKYNLGVSSATIRNEMADLEDLGYLVQPHASAGRIPTQKAYRFYVDKYMQVFDLPPTVSEEVRTQYEQYLGELEAAVEKTAEILNKLTNYTALITSPNIAETNIRDVHLIPVENERILIVVITMQGIVKSAEFKLDIIPTSSQLERVGNFLTFCKKIKTEYSAGRFASEYELLDRTEQKILSQIVPAINLLLNTSSDTKIYSNGLTEILNHPEFQNTAKAKQILDTLYKQELVGMLLASNNESLDIKIGSETEVNELEDCSLITATYKYNGVPIGTIGLIGPTRMDYDKCVSALNVMTNQLSKYINDSIGGNDLDN